jgi:hypothetical protein
MSNYNFFHGLALLCLMSSTLLNSTTIENDYSQPVIVQFIKSDYDPKFSLPGYAIELQPDEKQERYLQGVYLVTVIPKSLCYAPQGGSTVVLSAKRFVFNSADMEILRIGAEGIPYKKEGHDEL